MYVYMCACVNVYMQVNLVLGPQMCVRMFMRVCMYVGVCMYAHVFGNLSTHS
jgi:hypothetical protein